MTSSQLVGEPGFKGYAAEAGGRRGGKGASLGTSTESLVMFTGRGGRTGAEQELWGPGGTRGS